MVDVRDHLRANGVPTAEVRSTDGRYDCGDISGLPDWALELKNEKEFHLGTWMGEAERERDNAGTKYGVVIFPRRGKGVAGAYVLLTMDQWLKMLQDGGWI